MMKIIDMLFYSFSIITTEYIFIYNYGSMTDQKLKFNLKNIMIILLFSLLTYINNYYNWIHFRIFTGMLITLFANKLVYKNKILKTIFYSIIQAIIYVMLEILLSPLLMFKINNVFLFNKEIYLKSIFSLLVGVISIYIFKNKKIITFIEKLKTISINNINLLILIIPVALIFLNTLAVFRVIDLRNIYMLILSISSIIFMIISIRIIINDKYNLKIIYERNINLKDSFKAYSKTIDDCREIKHNLKNDLYALKTGLKKEDQEKINVLINKYNQNYKWINMIDEIPEGIQGLIYLKQKEADKKKIKIYINTIQNIKTNNNKDYIDLCTILGILIDNSMEAAIKTKEKVIEIIFKEVKNSLNIKIINSYSNNIDLNKIGKKNYSTKEYKSGLGLNYIRNLNNPKMKVNFKIINNLFITNILYYTKNQTSK